MFLQAKISHTPGGQVLPVTIPVNFWYTFPSGYLQQIGDDD